MQSFHRSRGRILFEVFCALAIAESCVGAWKQTGAWAFLPAGAVAALYGLVHAFDMVGRRSAVAAVPQRVDTVTPQETTATADEASFVPSPPVELQLTRVSSVEEGEKIEPVAPRPSRARKAKAAPKANRRRASAREEKVAELTLPEEPKLTKLAPPEPQVTEAAPPEEPTVAEVEPLEEPKVTPFPRPEEAPPVPLTPLFEPKPFVRLQRAGFGRKA